MQNTPQSGRISPIYTLFDAHQNTRKAIRDRFRSPSTIFRKEMDYEFLPSSDQRYSSGF